MIDDIIYIDIQYFEIESELQDSKINQIIFGNDQITDYEIDLIEYTSIF